MAVITTPDLATQIARKLAEGGYTLIANAGFAPTLIKTDTLDLNAPVSENVDVIFSNGNDADLIGEVVAKVSEFHSAVKVTVPRPTIFTFQSRYWLVIPNSGSESWVLGFVSLPDIFKTKPMYRRDIVRTKDQSCPVSITGDVSIVAPAAAK